MTPRTLGFTEAIEALLDRLSTDLYVQGYDEEKYHDTIDQMFCLLGDLRKLEK